MRVVTCVALLLGSLTVASSAAGQGTRAPAREVRDPVMAGIILTAQQQLAVARLDASYSGEVWRVIRTPMSERSETRIVVERLLRDRHRAFYAILTPAQRSQWVANVDEISRRDGEGSVIGLRMP